MPHHANVSITSYREGSGVRYIRDELIVYGTHDICTNETEQHIGLRRYSLWVSEMFGDGALSRIHRNYDDRVPDSEQVDRMTRQDVSMWLPIVETA